MIFFTAIVILSLLIYLIVNYFFILFLNKQTLNINNNQLHKITISVVVAARNEERNIERLLRSLLKINYPKDRFEVIIVDDQSTDSTNSIVQRLIKDTPNFKLISSEGKIYPAKKGALAIGINSANFEYILTTDADCVVQSDWLNISASQFANGSDIIFGLTPYFKSGNIINRISSFERFRGQLLSFVFAKLNFPYSAGGGNFGFKKASFVKIKGYENTLQTLSGDDDLVINEAVKHKFTITPFLNSNHFVNTESPKSWKIYFNQRARHTSTSIYYRKEIQAALALWHLSNIFLLFSPILIIYNSIFLIPFIIKIIIDLFTVKYLSYNFDYNFNFFAITPLQISYELLLIIHFINSFRRSKPW